MKKFPRVAKTALTVYKRETCDAASAPMSEAIFYFILKQNKMAPTTGAF